MVAMVSGGRQLLTSHDRADALQWMEAIEVCVTMEPSPLLLHATGGGTVILAGHVECQEFALDTGKHNPLQAPFRCRLGTKVDLNNSFVAVDYGKHWTVLKNTGLVQCLVDGKPEVLLDLANCRVVTVFNPKLTLAGSDYSIEVETSSSKVVLRADQPSDHSDWSLAIESILKREGREGILKGNRCDESGYVALKRLLMMNSTPGGTGGGANGWYSLPPRFNDMDDIYTCEPASPSPKGPSPLSPKGVSIALSHAPPTRRGPTPLPLPPKHSTAPNQACPLRGSPLASQTLMRLGMSMLLWNHCRLQHRQVGEEPSHVPSPSAALVCPPNLPPSSPPSPSLFQTGVPSLLRNDSESSSFTNSPPTFGTSFGESEHFGGERLYGGQLTPVRNNPLREGGNPLMHQDVSCHSLRGVEQQVPPLPPRNGERGMVERGPHPSAGSFTKVSSSSLQRSNSSLNRMSPLTPTHSSYNGKWSRSEGMMVFEAQRQLSQQPAKMADPPNQLYGSDTRLDNRSNSSLDSDQGKVRIFSFAKRIN